ncbi:MAG TPA: hypothetical protein VK872_06660 [Draconibacterium sp.]|jgi:hypothetical protein|nr:hypothetical protein [Draconibacterium sp.]
MKFDLYLVSVIFVQLISNAQSFQYQPDKPGKFIFDNRLDKCKMTCYKVKHEIDSINYEKMVAGWAKMNFNPDCLYRSMPVTAEQYLSWQYRPETQEELEKFKPRNNGLTDFVGLFFNSLPVEKMEVLIDKK